MLPKIDDSDSSYIPMDFSKIRVSSKFLEDATLNIGSYRKINKELGDKQEILRAIHDCNYKQLRRISNFFYKNCGIYSRLCRYVAYLYNYDWIVTPFIVQENLSTNKILTNFNNALQYLDNFQIKRMFGEIALKVIKNGCYYGYLIHTDDKHLSIQELDPDYCRSRFKVNSRPAIEFNMSYFDHHFRDETEREKILNLFPNEFKKGYNLYKKGKLVGDFPGDVAGWYLLNIEDTVKFNLNDEDLPAFISVIPAIIDLDEAEDLYKRKMEQQLLKIIIQKMPVDKNGDLVFDVDEAQQLHENAVQMLGHAIGIDVLTTFADVQVADMSDSTVTTTNNELDAVKQIVYDEAGVSQMQFNTDGNIALEKSTRNDEAMMYNLLTQFESFINQDLLKSFNKKPRQIYFRAQLLKTTIYNYDNMAKLYKEQTQLGYSKMLPQIALGQSQSSILANAHFENDILNLVDVFIPPLMSSTMNAEVLDKNTGESNVGRTEKREDEKSEKTIANEESMS